MQMCTKARGKHAEWSLFIQDIVDLHDSLRYRCSKETTECAKIHDHLLIFIARLHTHTHTLMTPHTQQPVVK